MRKDKRGISAVIVTLVIIFLAFVSTGIVWGVVKNIISSGSEGISLGGLTTEVEIQSVKVEDEKINVDVRRNVGGGEVTRLKFVFSDGQDSGVIERTVSLEELGQERFTFFLSQLPVTSLKKVTVAPVYKSETGKETTGKIMDEFEFKEGEEVFWEKIVGNFEKYGPVGFEKTEYAISGEAGKLPEFSKAIVDPLDVKVGDNQTFWAYVSSPHEITEVTTVTQLDTEILVLPLEKTENANEYKGTWTVYDTHTRDYRTTIIARDSAGNENNVTLTWTDPCSDVDDHGSVFNLDFDCQVSAGFDGIDNGDITISSGRTLTLTGGTFVFTPGNSVTIDGTIAFSGGSLQKAYLYYVDADGDGYGTGYASGVTATAPGGHIRAKDAINDSDCNDGTSLENVNRESLSSDDDQDGYTDSSAATRCVDDIILKVGGRNYYRDSSSSFKWLVDSQKLGTSDCNDASSSVFVTGFVDVDNDGFGVGSSTCHGSNNAAQGGDCYDSNANANPGQTSYFSAHRGDGSYDYNCDSSATKRWTSVNGGLASCSSDAPPCFNSGGGSGWTTGSSPACGASGTYVTDGGTCDEWDVGVCSVQGFSSASRTQECR